MRLGEPSSHHPAPTVLSVGRTQKPADRFPCHTSPGPDYTRNKVSTALPLALDTSHHLTNISNLPGEKLGRGVLTRANLLGTAEPAITAWFAVTLIHWRRWQLRLVPRWLAPHGGLGVSQRRAGRPFGQRSSCGDLVWICRVHRQAQSSKKKKKIPGATEQTALLDPSHFAPHLRAVGCQRKTTSLELSV